MRKYNLNAQTAFWQIRPDELVLFEQDIKNAMELPVDFRVELNAQDLFAVLHHIDGAVLRPSGDGEPGRNTPQNGDERPTFFYTPSSSKIGARIFFTEPSCSAL